MNDANLLSTKVDRPLSFAFPLDDYIFIRGTGLRPHDETPGYLPMLTDATSLSGGDNKEWRGSNGSISQFSHLDNLPIEILALICGNLDAVWLYNLSHVSSGLYRSLNGPDANRIWYNVLPKALWRKRERYQDYSELNHWAAIDLEDAMQRKAIAKKVASEAHSRLNSSAFQPEAAPNSTQSEPEAAMEGLNLTDDTPWSSAHFDLWVNPLTPDVSPRQSVSPMTDLEPSPVWRPGVLALGGPYQHLCSYKKEIIGHLKSRRRCHICFGRDRFYAKNPVKIQRWGLMWCQKCLSQHTISSSEFVDLVKNINRSNFGTRFTIPYREFLRRILFGDVGFDCMVTQVSEVFVRHGCGTVDTERLRRLASDARQVYRRQNDNAERRHVRNLIVAAAENIWEGRNPVDRPNKYGTYNIHEYNQLQFSPSDCAVWRERFAPTSRLRHLLFPPHLLSDETPPFDKSAVRADLMYEYPADPLVNIHLKALRNLVCQPTWIAWQAALMLRRLTDFRNPAYNSLGFGGFCTTWNEAAREYHRHRLEAKLDQAIRNGDLLPFAYRSTPDRSTIAQRLRLEEMDIVRQAGLNDAEKTRSLRQIFARPDIFEPYETTVNEVYERVMALEKKESDFDNRLRHAKKILLATCKKCPINRLNVSKKGIDAILNHMRDAHPEMWWRSDDWYLIG